MHITYVIFSRVQCVFVSGPQEMGPYERAAKKWIHIVGVWGQGKKKKTHSQGHRWHIFISRVTCENWIVNWISILYVNWIINLHAASSRVQWQFYQSPRVSLHGGCGLTNYSCIMTTFKNFLKNWEGARYWVGYLFKWNNAEFVFSWNARIWCH